MIKYKDESREYPIPFFSVIITTYNRALLFKTALDSLIAQTETNWEAIIIDDGSTDNTASLLESYLGDGSKIKYVYQKNAGYAMAKNTGIFHSKGKFITFLDSDDEYLPNHLESRKTILDNYPQTDFLYGGVTVTGNQFVPDRFDYNKLVPLSECVIGGTFFIRKEVAVALNGFADTPMGSDADFFERVNKTNAVIRETDIPTYLYHRENENSVTNNLMRKENLLH